MGVNFWTALGEADFCCQGASCFVSWMERHSFLLLYKLNKAVKNNNPSVSSAFSSHLFKDIPLLGSCAHYLAGFEEERYPVPFHPSQWCSPAKLSAFKTWGNFTCTVAVCSAFHPQRQNYYLEQAAGSFLTAWPSRISASRNQRWAAKEEGNLQTNTELLSKCPYVYKDCPGKIQFFFENSLVGIFQCSVALILSSAPEQNCNIFETIVLALIQ